MDWLKWVPCWGIQVWDYMNSTSDPGRGPVDWAVTTFQKREKKKKENEFSCLLKMGINSHFHLHPDHED